MTLLEALAGLIPSFPNFTAEALSPSQSFLQTKLHAPATGFGGGEGFGSDDEGDGSGKRPLWPLPPWADPRAKIRKYLKRLIKTKKRIGRGRRVLGRKRGLGRRRALRLRPFTEDTGHGGEGSSPRAGPSLSAKTTGFPSEASTSSQGGFPSPHDTTQTGGSGGPVEVPYSPDTGSGSGATGDAGTVEGRGGPEETHETPSGPPSVHEVQPLGWPPQPPSPQPPPSSPPPPEPSPPPPPSPPPFGSAPPTP